MESVDSAMSIQQQIAQQQFQAHRRLSQQNSLDKISDVIGNGASGPQTIADLQHKLTQLTSQPSESHAVNTPPISHPATPHAQQMPANYEAYMHSLQQKLVSAGVPAQGWVRNI